MEDTSSNLTRNRPDMLTSREQEVLRCLSEGLSNQEIANRLYLAEKTIRWYNTQIYGKLGVGSRQEAVERAQALGLLDIDTDSSIITGKHNLLAQTTPFVGRQRELNELSALLDDADNRLITILAPGGMGKTRLALEVARMHIGRYANGVYFVPLTSLNDAGDIVTAIAEIIGFNFFGSDPPVQQLIGFLGDRSVLLVLDNFEHLLDGALLVSELVQAGPGVRVLTTTRERLNLRGETVYALRGMEFPTRETIEDTAHYEALTLFVQSARRVRPDFILQPDNLDYLARICRLTAGMPLGIELAAGWVDVLPLKQITDEIQRGIDILETEMRDVPERQRSVRATFDHTWERLSADEQQAFMRLSVFRGGFTVEAAKVVAEADRHALRKLANKALVQVTSDERYDIHELLRQFAAEKLGALGQQSQMQAKHTAFFADFMIQQQQGIKTDRQLEALNLIGVDFENVRTAWLHTITEQDWATLPKFLYSLWFYVQVRARGQIGIELHEYAVQALHAGPASAETELALGRVLARLGWFYKDIGSIDKAAAVFEKAIDILHQHDSPEDLITALHGQQNVSTREQWMIALNATQAGLNAARAIGDRHWEGHILIYAGLLDDVRGEYVSARQYAEEAYAIFKEIGDRWGLMITYITLGRIAMNQKQYDEARYWFRHTQPLAEVFRHVWNLASLHMFYSAIAFEKRDFAAAHVELIKGVSIIWHSGYQWIVPRNLTHFARLFIEQNALERAVEIIGTLDKYPLAFGENDQVVKTLRDQVQAKLEPELFAAAWARGQNKELNVLVHELLAEFGDA